MNRVKRLFWLSTALAVTLFGAGRAVAQSEIASSQNGETETIGLKLTLSGEFKIPIGNRFLRFPITVPVDSGSVLLDRDATLGENILDPNALVDIDPELRQAAANAIQPFVNQLASLGIRIPSQAFPDRNVRLRIDFRNFSVNSENPQQPEISPIIVDGVTIPVFFFVRLTMEKDGKALDRFDFKPGFPLTLRIPVGALQDLLNASGFPDVNFSDLLLAFVTPRELEREGIFTQLDEENNVLIVRTSHLGDLVGLRAADVKPPRPAAITQGPSAVTDTNFATIVWRTDRTATTQVQYGPSKASLLSLPDSVVKTADDLGVLAHAVRITGLNVSTKYFYRVWSLDGLGRRVASPIDSFKTRGVQDLAAPVFSVYPFVRDRNPDNATIAWSTDRLADGKVSLFDTTKVFIKQASDSSPVVLHSITIAGLTANTKYLFVASSSVGEPAVYSDTLKFKTPETQDTTPLVITVPSRVDGFSVTDTTALIQWRTNFPGNTQVIYWEQGTTDTSLSFFSENTTDHTVILTGLEAATQYRYFVRSTRGSTGQIVSGTVDGFKTKKSDQIVPLRFVESPGVVYRTNTRVVMGWKTNQPSDGFVYYQRVAPGTTVLNADSALLRGSADLSPTHSVTVGGLTAGANYLFVIISRSANGQTLFFPPGVTISTKALASSPLGAAVITGMLQVPGGQGSFTTSSGPDTQAPVILNGPTIISQSSTSLILQWQTDELSSSVVNFGPGGNLNQTVTDGQQVTSHQLTLSNLTPSTSYSYQVSSTDPSNNGPTASGTAVSSTVQNADTTPPAVDAASIAAYPSNNQAIIQWNTDEGANSEVQFGTHQDSLSNSLVASDITTSHGVTVTGLDVSKKYFYRVFSTDASNNTSIQSSTKNFTTAAVADTAHPVISNLQATAVAQSGGVSIAFTWTTDKLASSFVDYDTQDSLATQQAIGTQTGSIQHSLTVTGLALNTQYFYQVGSANVNDARVPASTSTSSTLNITTPASADATAPSVPTIAAKDGNGAVLLRWSKSIDVSGIKGYNLSRGGSLLVSNVTDTTFLDQTVTNGTGYTYTAVAVDNANNSSSASSASTSVTPGTTRVPTAPTGRTRPDTVSVKPIVIVENSTAVLGDASRATLTYSFQVATDSLFASIIASETGIGQGTTGNPTHWQILDVGRPDSTALVGATRYWWRSSAFDGAFSGPYSTSKQFVTSNAKPTAVALASMIASPDRGVVAVEWVVGRSDLLQAGFNVYRSQQRDVGFVLMTEHPLTSVTNAFRFTDGAVRVGQEYFYLIEAVSTDGTTERFGPISVKVGAPTSFSLKQNAPNPFNPSTTIRFDLPQADRVTLVVYNLLGQEVIRLIDNVAFEAGYQSVVWNGRNANGQSTSSGVYLYRVTAGEFVSAKKMLLLK